MIALSTGYKIIYIFFDTDYLMALINTNTHNFFSSYHLKHATKQHDIIQFFYMNQVFLSIDSYFLH